MATSVRLLRRYVWLIDTIRHAKNITLEEINRKWLDERALRLEDEGIIPERTFHRHRQAIADIFGIDILCNRFDGNTYYIDNEESLTQPSFTSWLFNGLAIDNQLMADKHVADRIIFENAPGGNEYLSPIIEAIAKTKIISLIYSRYGSGDERQWTLDPYGLKQSSRRWYLFGRICGSEYPTVLALDRITSLRVTDDTFERDPSIDISKHFEDVVGVNVDEDFDCETITLRVYGHQRAYIEDLPLHRSQRRISRTPDYSDYELTLRPEYEFQHAILRLGSDAEILSPAWLRDEMKWHATEILKRYSD